MTEEHVKSILGEVSGWMTADPIETARMILRPFHDDADDFSDFYEFASQKELQRLSGMEGIDSPESARGEFNKMLPTNHTPLSFAVVLKENMKIVGHFSIGIYPFVITDKALENKRGVSLSFALSEKYQKAGLMTELLSSALDYYFCRGLDFVNCGYFEFNEGSKRLQEKVGMHYYMDHIVERDGKKINTKEMILFRDEYRKQIAT